MVTMEELTNIMLGLAEGKLSPDQWLEWWKRHEADVETLLNRGEYLRIKPKQWEMESVWRPIYACQEAAFQYLQERNIPFRASFRYRDKWNEEFDEYCRAEDRKQKEQASALKSQFPLLFQRYPKFAGSLQHTYTIGDTIGTGLSEPDIVLWEAEHNVQLTDDVKLFFQTCNPLRLEGIQLDINAMHPLTIGKKHWWVLGEFWKEADGDLLLIQMDVNKNVAPIYYYAHELNKVKKLCAGMTELLENKMAWYNRNQA